VLLAGCGGLPFTIGEGDAGSDAGALEIDAAPTDFARAATYDRTYPEASPEAAPAPPDSGALPPRGDADDAGAADVRVEAASPDGGPDARPSGGVCVAHADCAGLCAPTELKPVCDDPGGFGKGACGCSGCTDGVGAQECVAWCSAIGKTADAGARPYCAGPAVHQLPDRTTYTAAVCMCGI